MKEISATDASRQFADLLDAVEHRGERFVIVRRGRPVAQLERVTAGRGRDVKELFRRHRRDAAWSTELDELRALVELQQR